MPGNRPEMPQVRRQTAHQSTSAQCSRCPAVVPTGKPMMMMHRCRIRLTPSACCRHGPPCPFPPCPFPPCRPPPSPPALRAHTQVANETRAEFAKGLAEAMKRSVDKKADHLDWEHRLEEAAAQPAAAGGKEVSRCRCHRAGLLASAGTSSASEDSLWLPVEGFRCARAGSSTAQCRSQLNRLPSCLLLLHSPHGLHAPAGRRRRRQQEEEER
jgi:hypothetical protein